MKSNHNTTIDASTGIPGARQNQTNNIRVLVGSPTYRGGAYALDPFLQNQREIQQSYPDSELVLATAEPDFAPELESLLSSYGIDGKVLLYEVVKPSYARSAAWNVSGGRERIRNYLLCETKADYLLSLDWDKTPPAPRLPPEIIEKTRERYLEALKRLTA